MESIKLYSWNINGIRAAYKKGLVSWIKKIKPDILCLQEVRAREGQIPDEIMELDGYNKFFSHPAKPGYSGVGIFSKVEPINIEADLGINKFDSEGRILMADYGQFVLFNVYFPNGGRGNIRVPYKMEFYKEFLKVVQDYKKKGRKIIICGDINTAHKEIDLARPKQNQDNTGFLDIERKWIDKLIDAGFIDTFREFNKKLDQYTWWDQKTRARDRNVGWRIDYFFVSKNLKKNLKSAKIYPEVMGSDHCPISLSFDI